MRVFKESRSRRIGLAALLAAVVIGLLAYSLLQSAAKRLAAEASDVRVTSAERLSDINSLSQIPGRCATQLLIGIATNPGVLFDSRNAAVAVLKRKNDPTISGDLAMLLQPHTAETLRSAVADALVQLPCSFECARSILHYLERMWRGDPNSEDLRLDSPPTASLAKTNPEMIKEKIDRTHELRQQLVSELDNVLSKNRRETLAGLREIYGLGSYHPSYFALYMMVELHLSEACSDLNKPHLEDIDGAKMAAQIRAVRQQVCSSP